MDEDETPPHSGNSLCIHLNLGKSDNGTANRAAHQASPHSRHKSTHLKATFLVSKNHQEYLPFDLSSIVLRV